MKPKRNFFQKLGNFITDILLIILIPFFIISIVWLYTSVTNSNEIESFFGFKPVIINNNDMKSALNKNDFVIVKSLDSETTIKTGNIVTYRDANGNIVTDRIVKIVYQADKNVESDVSEYVTKADNKKSNDKDKLFSDSIEGVYIFKIPYIGKYMHYIEKRFSLMISLPILFFAILIIITIWGLCNPDNDEEKEKDKPVEADNKDTKEEEKKTPKIPQVEPLPEIKIVPPNEASILNQPEVEKPVVKPEPVKPNNTVTVTPVVVPQNNQTVKQNNVTAPQVVPLNPNNKESK